MKDKVGWHAWSLGMGYWLWKRIRDDGFVKMGLDMFGHGWAVVRTSGKRFVMMRRMTTMSVKQQQ